MVVYISVLGSLILLTIFASIFKSKMAVIIMGIIMAVFSGLRSNVGFDYIQYQRVYEQIKMGINLSSIQPKFEAGYLFLNWFAVQIGISFHVFLLFFSCLSIGLLTFFLTRFLNSQMASFALLYYFSRFYFTRDFGQIRASLAAIICLFAVQLILTKKDWAAIGVVLVGSLFQKVAIIMIPIFLILKVLKGRLNVVSFFAFIGLCAAIAQVTSGFLKSHSELLGLYSSYATADLYTQGSGLLNPVIWMQVVIGFLAVLFFFQITTGISGLEASTKVESPLLSKIQTLITIYFLGTLILVLFNQLPTAAGRTSTVLNTVEIFLVPLVIKRIVNKRMVLFIYIPVVAIVWYVFFLHTNTNLFIPYLTFLEGVN